MKDTRSLKWIIRKVMSSNSLRSPELLNLERILHINLWIRNNMNLTEQKVGM